MSSRARTRIAIAAIALVAAVAAGLVAWVGRGEEEIAQPEQGGPRPGAPPLVLDAIVDDPATAAALRSAASLYENGDRRAALDAFREMLDRDPDSLYAAVGVALSVWPEGTLEELRALERREPGSGLVQLHLGLALFWTGREREAESAWRRAEELEPDTSAAIRAESLLHPEMPAGRPFFVPGTQLPRELSDELPSRQLEELRRRALDGAAGDWIHYGTALQRAGRSISAADAFDRAVELEPDNVEALVGAAIARFDKDDPSQTFSRLGPLAERFPDAAVVRFHLGLSLIWLRELTEATEQLERAIAAGPDSIWSQEAARLLASIDGAQAGS